MRQSLLLSLALASALSAQTSYFSASLDGAQEVPPNASTARGFGIVRVVEPANQVTVFLYHTLAATTASHIHLAPAGTNGGVILPLAAGPNGTYTGTGVLSAANITALKSSGCYLNVHTTAFPGGEIRGQIETARATRMVAEMTGAQEVPPNNSPNRGACVAFLHEPDNVVSYMVDAASLASITGAHLHRAPAGQNGPVVVPLNGAGGVYCGVSSKLSAADVTLFKNNGFYANVHTQQFPGGEIRGQLGPTPGDFAVPMEGAQEVPPVTTNMLGEFSAALNPDNSLTFKVSFAGNTTAITGMHLHRAPAGQNGPVVIPLTTSGTTRPLTPAELTEIRNDGWYANVHTQANPGGEIRGQLRLTNLPASFGLACPDAGNRSQIVALNAPAIGDRFDVLLAGAQANRAAALLIGATRDQPYPINLLPIGMNNGCFLMHDILLSVPSNTNAIGCARLGLPVTFDAGLRGGTVFLSWVHVAPGANSLGLVGGNALSATIN
jgi:Cu/Zn superoxide dismutase